MSLEDEVAALRRQVQLLQDRAEIRDCTERYARGLDRHDEEMLASAYHPDALEVHGRHFVGPIPDFVKWVNGLHAATYAAHQHFITNHRAEVDGDTAHAETYVLHVLRRHDGIVDLGGSRYIDRLERRSGVWKIALRHVRVEWYCNADGRIYEDIAALYPCGAWDHSDPTYQRPLTAPGDLEDLRAAAPPEHG